MAPPPISGAVIEYGCLCVFVGMAVYAEEEEEGSPSASGVEACLV